MYVTISFWWSSPTIFYQSTLVLSIMLTRTALSYKFLQNYVKCRRCIIRRHSKCERYLDPHVQRLTWGDNKSKFERRQVTSYTYVSLVLNVYWKFEVCIGFSIKIFYFNRNMHLESQAYESRFKGFQKLRTKRPDTY